MISQYYTDIFTHNLHQAKIQMLKNESWETGLKKYHVTNFCMKPKDIMSSFVRLPSLKCVSFGEPFRFACGHYVTLQDQKTNYPASSLYLHLNSI